ncbi:carbonic anhydrase [Brachybacterium huguangmaarense]
MTESTRTPDDTSADPRAALERLLEGNARFADDAPVHPNQSAGHRRILTGRQSPFAVVLGCSDSRASVELLFDQGFGDLFVVRNAGQVVGGHGSAQASIEFAVDKLGVQVVLVLGHEGCGAVAATVAHLEGAEPLPGSMQVLVDLTAPHLDPADPSSDAVERHVRGAVADLRGMSEIVAAAEAEGRIVVAGGVYSLHDGRVRAVELPAPR